ncbi:MAG: hypothetical protein J6Z49_06185 [Kiritimatiellae bacterium]|nr:hypothetical protein [Kiritimatiellia bacterium]
MDTNKETVPRFEGCNWDEPVVKVQRNGRETTLHRKVLTRGVKTLNVGNVMKQAKELLRRGIEVRLSDECGNEAVRFFPLASTDCKRMFVKSQAMGGFSQCLADKKLRIRHCGKEIGKVETKRLVDEQSALCSATEPDRPNVTPDTVVTCPNCGTEFRVGRSMKE